jgi:hypothetical protein
VDSGPIQPNPAGRHIHFGSSSVLTLHHHHHFNQLHLHDNAFISHNRVD